MAYILNVTFRINRKISDLTAYGVEILEVDDATVTDRLVEQGPTFNDLARSSGVYGTKADATRAALRFINAPCKLVEVSDPFSDRIKVLMHKARVPLSDYQTATVIGRNTPNGVFVAA